MRKTLTLIIAFILLSITTFGLYLYKKTHYTFENKDTLFTIAPGQGFSKINYNLFKEGLIDDASFFYRYVKFKNKTSAFKAGTYEIKQGMTLADILKELTEGSPILSKVTISEGKNLYEIASILEDNSITNRENFIKLCKDQKFIQSLGLDVTNLEGYLYPETYKFAPQTNAEFIIQSMVNLFKEKTKNLDFSKSALSPYEVLTLASIVEKETGAAWERSIIAGVYLNRLKKPMRLQADPTTIYGVWQSYSGNLKRKHLLEKNDYNTYKINGLPIGPIANPSTAAMEAVLNPKKHNYLYFVSKNDGTHIFTSTYKEHLQAVREFQLNKKNRDGKSWRDLKTN